MMDSVRIGHSKGKMLFFDGHATVDAKQVNFLLSGLNPRAGKA